MIARLRAARDWFRSARDFPHETPWSAGELSRLGLQARALSRRDKRAEREITRRARRLRGNRMPGAES